MEKGEREKCFGGSWLTGRHMARLVFLSVFCLCLWASCLSQAAMGAAETGSLMRHGGTVRRRSWSRSDGGRATGRNSTAANPAPFQAIYIISSLVEPIPTLHHPPVFHLTRHLTTCWSGKQTALQLLNVSHKCR